MPLLTKSSSSHPIPNTYDFLCNARYTSGSYIYNCSISHLLLLVHLLCLVYRFVVFDDRLSLLSVSVSLLLARLHRRFFSLACDCIDDFGETRLIRVRAKNKGAGLASARVL